MKPVIIIALAVVLLFVPSTVLAETQYRTTSVSTLVDLGPLDIKADYDLGFNIIIPSVIEAGDTVEITLVPTSSTVTSTVTLSGDRIGTFTTDLVLGQEATFGIPGGYGIGLFATSNAYVYPTVSGPAYIIANDWISLNGMGARTFQVSVNNDIGSYDSVTLEFKTLLDTELGANLNLILFTEKLASESFRLEPSYKMPVKIPLKKTVSTYLSLDVRDGFGCQGCIQVKPTLTDQNGQKVYSTKISISMDGRSSQSGLTSNQWSRDFSPGYGSHNIKAQYFGETSSTNKAIKYLSSSDSESYTIQKSVSSTSKQSNAKNSLTCGAGTHEENGQCVADARDGGCLIATATFGSELAPQVQQLREIRDNTLLQTNSGSAFMESFNQFYYSFSPTIADWERENPVFKEAVKIVITPLITSLSILNYVDIDSEAEVLGYGISLILLNVGMYFVLPAIFVIKIRRMKN